MGAQASQGGLQSTATQDEPLPSAPQPPSQQTAINMQLLDWMNVSKFTLDKLTTSAKITPTEHFLNALAAFRDTCDELAQKANAELEAIEEKTAEKQP